MDLAKFSQLPQTGNGTYLKFTTGDNTKIVRFCYERVEDIQCRQKKYDPATRKVVWDTEDGKWTMNLRVAVYKDKTNYEMMNWDRSAAFGRDNLLPIFESAGGRIIDTVYKITCQKAGTLDATYTLFPLANSAEFAMPELEVAPVEAQPATQPTAQAPVAPTPAPAVAPTPVVQPAPATAQPAKKKNFWEE